MISDERLQYIMTTGNTRGKDAQDMAKELLALRKAFSWPVAFYASGAYYNTAKAALKDGAEDVMPLFTHPSRSE